MNFISLIGLSLSQISAGIKHLGFHFLVLWFLILMHMFNWAEPYRILININLIIVVFYGISYIRKGEDIPYRKVIAIFFVPVGYMVLHMIAVDRIVYVKEIRLLTLALFLTLGVSMLAKHKMAHVKQYILPSMILLLLTYVIIQTVAIVFFHKPFGTTKNPHYLAHYSALSLPVAAYCYSQVSSFRARILLASIILVLGTFVLLTSSRPAWLALMLSSLIWLFFLNKKKRILLFALILAIPVFLFISNVAHFGDRFTDLAKNITKEERVTIWQDTWTMQKTSNPKEWLVGHGLDSFLEDFKPYSNYHLQHIDFNGPHNFPLELLYTSGILGVFLFIFLCFFLYGYLIKSGKMRQEFSIVNGLLISILTLHLLFIMITIPFFRSYNLNIIALIGGAALFTRKLASKHEI